MIRGTSYTIDLIFNAEYDVTRVKDIRLTIGNYDVCSLADGISNSGQHFLCSIPSDITAVLPVGERPVTLTMEDATDGVRKAIIATIPIQNTGSQYENENVSETANMTLELTYMVNNISADLLITDVTALRAIAAAAAAKVSEDNAKISEDNAKESETNAAQSKSTTEGYKNTVQGLHDTVVADAAQVALDRIATGEDAAQTALDRIATGQDAQTATTKAGEASGSAAAALQSKNYASGYADTALQAKIDAEAAKSAAQLAKTNAETAETNAEAAEAQTLLYKDAAAAIVSGGPRGVYATAAALITANPDHLYTYVVTADGHWYYWNGSTFADGGAYQTVQDYAIRANIESKAKMSIKPFLITGGSFSRTDDTFTLSKCAFFHGNGRYTMITDGTYTLTEGKMYVVSNIDVDTNYDGLEQPVKDLVLKSFSDITKDDIILIYRGFVNDCYSIWDNDRAPINTAIVTKHENVNIEKIGGTWKIRAESGSISMQIGNTIVNNNAFNITLAMSDFSYIILDIVTQDAVVTSDNTEAYNLLYLNNRYLLLGKCFPQYGIYDIRCPFNVNGNPYNVEIPTGIDLSLTSDTPAITNTLAFKDDEETPIYKDGLFKSIEGGRKCNVVLETTVGTKFKRYEIGNPTYLKASQIGTSARIVLESNLESRKLIYKDITKIYKGLSTGHSGTLKLMTIGDSLTNGDPSVLVSPMALIAARLLDVGVTVQPCGTFDQDDSRGDAPATYISEGRGYWNYKTFVGKDSSPYGQPVTISTGSGLTSKFENPFLREANATDKANHPDWCFSNAVANPSDTDGVSYATDPNQPSGKYYIFDFANYLTQHSVTTPDIITIALGINDWQEEGVINIDDEYLSMQIMYQQIRAALPNVKIILIPTNGVMPFNQTAWENEMFPLLERIITYCETQQGTDTKLYLCPIYQHVGRFNAFADIVDPANISDTNNVQQATANNVHILGKESSRLEYIDAFEASILGVL